MNINIPQLTINVNLHALQSDFLNLELHYIIAENEHTFRFTDWQTTPGAHELKFYCFLQEKELFIPAGDRILKESYVLTGEPVYPVVADCKDFVAVIERVLETKSARAVRQFTAGDLDKIKGDLKKTYATVETHLVASPELQHHIFVVDDTEISVAPTMVYFRIKAPFSEIHYRQAGEG